MQPTEVGGRLLLALAPSLRPMSLKDLAPQAALPAARAQPNLVSFGRLGLIEQAADTGRCALGQAVALAVWGNFGPTIVRRVAAQQPLHVSMRAGTVMSVLGKATGRAFAAALPAERVLKALVHAQAQPLGGDGDGDRPPPRRGTRRRPAHTRRQRLQRGGLRPRG